MPKQVTGVQLTDNGDGTIGVQIGAFGYSMRKSDLFDKAQNQDTVRTNIRLAFLVGGYTQLNSTEFLTGVNRGGKGMQGPDSKYIVADIALIDASQQLYEVTFAAKNGQIFGMQVKADSLTQDELDETVILANLNPFLRVGGFTDLTPAAIAAVAAHTFWY